MGIIRTPNPEVLERFINRKLDNYDYLKEISEEELDKRIAELNPKPEFHIPLFKHQKVMFLLGVQHHDFMYHAQMGLGKTSLVLNLISYYKKLNKVKKALVLVPNLVLIENWLDECVKHTPNLKAVAVHGVKEERLEILQTDADLYVLNYTGLQVILSQTTGKRTIYPADIQKFAEQFDLLALDEITAVSNISSLTFKICSRIAEIIPYRYGLTGRPFGRSQPLTSKILTPNGWKLMGEIKKGDKVIGKSGLPVEVKKVIPQGVKDIYKITFSDGSHTECSDDHLWSVFKRYQREKSSRYNYRVEPYILPLSEIKKDYIKYRKNSAHKRREYILSIVNPVQFSFQEVLVDPYVMGVLLGDGTFSNTSISFANIDLDLVEEMRVRLPDYNIIPIKSTDQYQDREWRVIQKTRLYRSPLIDSIKKYDLYYKSKTDKFVPEQYLFNDISVRQSILQGLCDTDGSVDNDGAIRFYNGSLHLIHAVCFLIRSLGGVCTILGPYIRDSKEGHLPEYVVRGQVPSYIVPFKLNRKVAKLAESKKIYNLYRAIDNIEFIGKKEAQCISIDSSDGLYATDDFILTHNSVEDLWAQFYCIDRGASLGKNYYFFRSAFFKPHKRPWAVEWKFNNLLTDDLHRILKNRSIRYKIDESKLPSLQQIPLRVEFPEDTLTYFNAANESLKHNIREGKRSEILSSFVKLREIASGFVNFTDDDDNKQQIVFDENPKLELLLAKLSEVPDDCQVIIFHEFIFSGQAVTDLLTKNKIEHRWIYGGTPDKEKLSYLKEFKTNPKIKVLILNNVSGSYGLNLQNASILFYYESPCDPKIREQGIARIYRTGQSKPVFIYDILVKNSVEEQILGFIREGKNLLQELIEARDDKYKKSVI